MSLRGAYNLGSTRGIGSSTRMFYFCRERNPQPWTCIDQFISVTPAPETIPSPGKMKTAFLLELTGGFIEGDTSIKNTINFYWNTYPKEFTKCPIVDTKGDINITLNLLDEYYNYGFRYFVGFSRSTILNNVLSWFNNHPDAVGISATSTAPSLNIPKNIFRMTANDHFMIDSIKTNLENKTVNYIYEANEYAATDLITYIQGITGITCNLYPIEQNSDLDALASLNTGHTGEIMLSYLITNRQYYLDLFKDTTSILTYTNAQYDILGIVSPSITDSPVLINNYNTSQFKGTETSVLWRNGYITLTSKDFSIVSLNILNILNTFVNNYIVDNINSHFGILQFDPVIRDILYSNYLIETYTSNNTFTSTSLFLVDPIFGKYTATFTNPAPVISYIQTPSYKPYGKAIALLELTNYSNNIDTIYNDSLYYYWYKNPSFPNFPIIDTGSSIPNTLTLLDTYYAQGYRVFLGFSRSSVVNGVLSWFNAHLDAVGISLWSTAISLNNVSRNIYRTTPSDDTIVNAVVPYLPPSSLGKVYYIYTDGELATLDVLSKLQSNANITLLTYAVNGTNTLTVANLQAFFSGATSDDVTIIYLFDNQPYYDLYNASPTPLTFPGKQYDIVNTQLPVINGAAQTELNDKLYYIQNTYPNTALLWRENADYLTIKAGGELTSSTGLANALTMIEYFQKGKNVGLLPSYSAVLQFNQYKDIEYPSFLFRVYKNSTNTFDESSVSFDDPLLGSFQANFL